MRVSAVLTVLCSGLVFGQSTERTQFEVADVHSVPKTSSTPVVRGPFYAAGRYELRSATMLDLIRLAYDVDPEKVSGGPSWLELDRFDVFAKTPERSTPESRRQMLQALLAERFHLEVRHASQPLPAWGLTARKLSMKESTNDKEGGCKFIPPNRPNGPQPGGGPVQIPVVTYACTNVTMTAFAAALMNAPAASSYLGNRLVVDQTGLKGAYDFDLRYTPKVPAGIEVTGEPIPLFEALERQLGLSLDAATVPMPVIVVDKVDRRPTPASSEALKSLPPQPTAFEVASLKPAPPDARGGQPDIRNGRLYVPAIPLRNLIGVAWDLNGPEFLANAPAWLAEDRYEILAKAPEGVAIGDRAPNRNTGTVNIDALRPMLRSLIAERFQMKAHMEDRPLDAYTLVANKPKLKKSDPGSRTRCKEGPAPESKSDKNATSTLGRLVTCQNLSMSQFAEMLPDLAPGYLRTNVVDATGLEGGYDFTFSFSPIGAVNRAAAPANGDQPSDPNGAISLFDALNKQLGLKLETVKRPMPVLVIDKIERKPQEN